MSKVRLLVGTRKGAFVLTADGTRDDWDVRGPFFTGWEIYHLNGSPADPDRIYASQTSGWFGQIVQRSDDGGETWEPVGNEFAYEGVAGTHQWYDGTQHPWEFARVWHFEPSPTDPDTVYAGAEDAALFKSDRRRPDLEGARGPPHAHDRRAVAAGRRRAVPALDPDPPREPRPDHRGDLRRRNVPHRRRRRDLAADQQGAALTGAAGRGARGGPLRPPHRDERVAPRRAVHAEALARDAERQRRRLVGQGEREPAVRLRLPDRRPRQRARHRLRRPDRERLRAHSARGQAPRLPQPHRRQRVGGAHERPAAEPLLREHPARRDGRRQPRPGGIYFGTTGGQVYASSDAGDTWTPIVRDLPAVLSVEAQVLP